MSIVDKNKVRQRPAAAAAAPVGAPVGAKPARAARKKRRGPIALGVAFLVLALLAGLLPTIVAHTSLMGYLIRRAAALDGSIAFQSASIGWFSATSVSGIAIADAQGETVLEADSLSCDRSLLGLIFHRSNLGKLRIEKPRLTAKLTHDGSNVETVFARWLTGPANSSSTGVDMSLEIADGDATIVDQDTQQSWHIADLQFALDMSRQLAWPSRIETSANIDGAPDRSGHGHPGSLALKSHLETSDAPPADPTGCCGLAGTDGDLNLQTTAFPLALVQRLFARAMPGLKCDGTLAASIDAQWTGPATVRLSGTAGGGGLCIESPVLGRDVLRLDQIQVSCKAMRQDKQLTIEEGKLVCDVGNLSASGHVDLGERGLVVPADLLSQPDCLVQGTLDLARLARLLPGTLRVRQGTEITSGQLQLAVHTRNSAAAPASLAWQATLEANHITAVDRGRQISWDKPVLLELAIHQTAQGPVVDNLHCQSDFLQITGSGTPEQINATVTLNLQRLTDGLGRFVDLGGLTLAGDGSGKLQYSRNAASDFELGGQLDLRNFQVATPQRQLCSETSLSVAVGAKGHADLASPPRLDSATLQLRTPGDQIDLRLLQPTSDLSFHTPLSVDCQMQGRLDSWPPRLAPFVSLPGLRLGGNYQAAGQLSLSTDAITFSQTKVNATQLAISGQSLNWSDPAVELNVAGRFDVAAARLQVDTATLSTSALALTANNIICSTSANGPMQIGGTIGYQGDLERLQPWIVAATGSTGLKLAGHLSIKADVQQSEGQIVIKSESDIEKLAVASPSGQSFQDPRLHCVLQCSYQVADNMLKIDRCELTSGVVGARAGGQISLRSPADVQLSGDISYQWDKLNVLLQPYVGSSVKFFGSGSSAISYRGPFAAARGEASATLQFTSGNVYGFQLGPGELKTHLAGGILRAEPLQVTCNQGSLTLQPELRMDRSPAELRLSAGTLASHILLDPAACRSALRFVAPVLSSVTQSQGQFSIVLEGCRVPLGDLNHAEIAGRMIVHSATMNAGALVQQLASLTSGSPSLIHIEPESVILFRMVGGRIYHQGLALQFPDVTMRTYGSVGVLDESVKLMVETSIPLKWLPSNQVTNAIKSQKMQIPIGGTLKSPQLDVGEIARVQKEVLGNLARGVLPQLENGLNRLIGPQR